MHCGLAATTKQMSLHVKWHIILLVVMQKWNTVSFSITKSHADSLLLLPKFQELKSSPNSYIYCWVHFTGLNNKKVYGNTQILNNIQSMLLLSRVSCVWLCATPYTAAHQVPPSLGFSRQEHWSGLPFPSPMHESEKWKWSCSVVSNS